MHSSRSRSRVILDIVEVVLFSLVLSWCLRSTVVEARVVPTGSMLPTIQLQDRVVVDKLFCKFSDIKRGDIVVFDPPSNIDSKGQQWIKRVIGLPGETVEIKNGKVFINGRALVEPYELEKPTYQFGPTVVTLDSFFVLGDNRNDSLDSHYWGVLPVKNIVGRAIFRYWPFVRFGSLAK
jgi:signal peptidase I